MADAGDFHFACGINLRDETGDFRRPDIKYGDADKASRKISGKDTGTNHILDSGFDVETTIKKDVVWDQDKLMSALDAMADADATHYGKFKVEVDERKFMAAPPAVQASLLPARTVKAGKPAFKISQTKGK